MKVIIAVLINKLITIVCKLFRFNGAQFPGSFVYDHIDKNILDKISHPKITIAVTGSSGKGTTCNLIKNVLIDNNYSVLLNESGNNGINGAISLNKPLDSNEDTFMEDVIPSNENIEEYVLSEMKSREIYNLKYEMPLEMSCVYELRLNRFTNMEISNLLEIPKKKVEKYVYNIKKMVKKLYCES
jgi:hypothetical protein